MLFFDIETDGLLTAGELHGQPVPAMTKIHCINIYDGITNQHERYDVESLPIALGVKRLQDADMVCGHNIIGYDIPAIQRIFPDFTVKNFVDTLTLARLCFPMIKLSDFGRVQKGQLPSKFIGLHPLEAWGYRLGVLKGNFGKTTDWETWSPAMSDYCEQDVLVTIKLWEACQNQDPSQQAVDLEMATEDIIQRQQRNGVGFNVEAAEKLLAELISKRGEYLDVVYKSFHPFYKKKGKTFIPKRDNKRLGYVAGAACSKIDLVDFSPTSAQHVYVWLRRKYGWEPTEFTKKSKIPEQFRYLFKDYYKQLGQDTWLEPKISDEILERLTEYKEAEPIQKVMMLTKRIAQLAEGDQAWLKHVTSECKIHGAVNTLGTRTRRMTHFYPNLAQVPAVYNPYGKQCRALFIPTHKGWVILGADLSGVEARVLSHYTFIFDGGQFMRLILEGDLHSANAELLSLLRDDAKTFFYAFLYGAGNKKLGNIAKKNAAYGKKMREKLLAKQSGLGKLIKALVNTNKERGHLIDLDGQRLVSVSDHSILNTLCQNAGALVAKRSWVIFDEVITHFGFVHGKDYAYMLNVHDEIQLECPAHKAEKLGKILIHSMAEAGKYYKLNVPITGEYKIGNNWKETH